MANGLVRLVLILALILFSLQASENLHQKAKQAAANISNCLNSLDTAGGTENLDGITC